MKKNATPEEFRKLVPFTAPQLLTMSGPELRRLIYGKGGGFVARPGVKEEIERIIAEWRAQG